jgi:membrane-bound lytic murein transglycosylase D
MHNDFTGALRRCLVFIAVPAIGIFAGTFDTPDILKPNVAFWKKIYTEVSLTEGLLHDSENPLVIYHKVTIGGREGRQRDNYVAPYRNEVLNSLSRIDSLPESEWTKRDRDIVALFVQQAGGRDAISGAKNRLRFQQGQRERFYEGLCRSGALIDTIRTILAAYNIPKELAFLPHVESSFNAHAYSKVGAAGLWQFMRSTGKLYLKIDYSIDERRDPIVSTYAAAKLLSHNYQELQAWPLAITAYNHGLGGMKRAVASTGSRDIAVIIQKHESPSFKFASKNFYGCFLAVCEIASEPGKYFGEVNYAPPIRFRDMVLSNHIQPSVLARSLGVEQDALAKLNLAIRPVVFQQQKYIPAGTRIHLPPAMSSEFADSAIAMVPESLKLDTAPGTDYYRVSRGDNLYGIARQFGIPVNTLIAENDITRSNRIFAGQVLRIPSGASSKAVPMVSFVDDKRDDTRLALPQNESRAAESAESLPQLSPAHLPAVPSRYPAKKTPSTTVKVQADVMPDTVKEAAMAAAEEPLPEIIETLKGQPQGRFDVEVYHLEVEISPVGDAASIRVSVDETMGHYAEWSGVALHRIRQLNRLSNHAVIHIGQRLTIPGDTIKIQKFVKKRLEYHMALEEDFYSQYKVAELRERIILKGENLWSLSGSDDGEMPVWLLQKYNKHIDFARILPGMQVWIPVIAEKTAGDFALEEKSGHGGGYPYYQAPVLPPYKPIRLVP